MKSEPTNTLNTLSIYQQISRDYMPSVLQQNDEVLPEIEAALKAEKTLTQETGMLVASNNVKFLKIPNNIKEIETGALAWCRNLTRVEIPGTVKKIGAEAFFACPVLEQVVISNGVEEIGDDAFSACSNLRAVKIPGSVKKIGMHAFFNCPVSFIEFPGKKLEKVQELENYPWGINNFEAKFNSKEQAEADEIELTSQNKKLKQVDTYDNGVEVFKAEDKK